MSRSLIYLSTLVLTIISINNFTEGQTLFGIDLSDINPFAGPPLDKEFQVRRYSCNSRVTLGVAKSCICTIKVVRKKTGSILQSLGCDGTDEAARNLMMEVSAVYNFTTVQALSRDLVGNTCPVGTDEDFRKLVQAVQSYRLSLTRPCPFPGFGRFEAVDADFDAKLVDKLNPVLPSGSYNAYVRIYSNRNNLTYAFQTLYGSKPIIDLGLSGIPIVGNALG